MKKVLFFILLVSCYFNQVCTAASPEAVNAPQYEKGVILNVSSEDLPQKNPIGQGKVEQLTIQITSGAESGKVVNSMNYSDPKSPYNIEVHSGDKVIVAITNDMGKTAYNVSDFDRINYIYYLLAIFIGCLVLFTRKVGIKSVLVIGLSIFLIFKVYIEQVLSGTQNLTLLTLVICTIIATVTLFSIGGLNKKSLAAVLGTLGGLAVAGVLSIIAIKCMHLTGLESEEAMMLKAMLPGVDFQGVLFSGMVFGALGAVMDVTISIASALYEMKSAQPDIAMKKLFITGMNVGKDIMGTMSNTLILAYAGSSLSLILLIASQKQYLCCML